MGSAVSEDISQDRRITGIVDFEINGVSDIIEKGFEAGITITFGGLFGALGEPG